MIGTRQLEAFRAVATHGSVARAASALGWSQPTVAHHLRALEAEIGSPVVSAQASGTSLTAVGRELLPHAEAVLERLRRAHDDVRAFAVDERKRLRIGLFPTIAARFAPDLVSELRSLGFDVVIREAEVDVLRSDLTELRSDAAVVYTTAADARGALDGFRTLDLFDEPLDMMVPMGHRLAPSTHVRLEDFADDQWVLSAQSGEPLGELLQTAADAAGLALRAAARSDDYRVIAAYVAAGEGVALIPLGAVPEAEPGVVRMPLSSPTLHRRVQLITSASLHAETVTALVDTLAAISPPRA